MTETTRTETDSLGTIEIDAARYWGPQTERARPKVAHYLRNLDDVTLANVGLTRRDIEEMARRTF